MAAGLGFKTFTTGEVLTAADTNGYLMQGILVFASAAARDAAITSPQEGQFAYLKDTNVTTYYTGSAWANVDTTGMTNPMTTTGDTIYSSSGSTPARLGIGSTGQVLTVAAGIPSWATPAGGGGMTLLSTTSCSGTSTTISGISGSYKQLIFYIYGITLNAGAIVTLRPNASSSITNMGALYFDANGVTARKVTSGSMDLADGDFATNGNNAITLTIDNYAQATNYKTFSLDATLEKGSTAGISGGGGIKTNSAITSLEITTTAGTSTFTGTILTYGVN